jgi:Fe-S cluster biogenesis protein NfuA
MSSIDSNEFQAQTERIERLVERLTSLEDSEARTAALDLLQALMDLHGAGISRMVELLGEAGESGRKSLAKLGGDPMVCGLMVLYGVHPVALQDRVNDAIEKVRPHVHKQGGTVEVLAVAEGTVRVSIHSSSNGCHSSPDALKLVVEQAIREAAPEVIEVVADGVPASTSGFIPLTQVQPAMKEEKRYEESPA